MDGRGKSFSHAFDQPGRYPYFCSQHETMTGTVVVE
jgi:plastocyanin